MENFIADMLYSAVFLRLGILLLVITYVTKKLKFLAKLTARALYLYL